MLPAPFFVRAFLWRTFVIWSVLKLIITAGQQAISEPEVPLFEALQLTPVGLFAMMGVVCAVVLIDTRRRNELLFLGNMGVARFTIGALAATPVLIAETLLIVVL